MLGTKITVAYLATDVTKVEGGFVPRANATKECSGNQIEKLLEALVPFSIDEEQRLEKANMYVLYIGGRDPTAFVLQIDDHIVRFKKTNSPYVYRSQNGEQFRNVLQKLEQEITSNPTWDEARRGAAR